MKNHKPQLKKHASPALLMLALVLGTTWSSVNADAANEAPKKQAEIKRGEYLVNIGGCVDCHTPLKMGPNGPEPDMTKHLSGHPAAMQMPPPPVSSNAWVWHGAATNTAFAGPWGVSYATNLTPHKVTGIGSWKVDDFVKAIKTGKHLGVGRPIMPPMPWPAYAKMTDSDLRAVFAYLQTLRPIENRVPDYQAPKK
jgi:mono/diheme cytochrome c family protein